MTDRYAVIGNPIAHSKSPQIHAAFARQTGEDLVYDRILGDLEHVDMDIDEFAAEGGAGLNVTVPFKERAFELCDSLTPRARDAGAVNTLTFEAGRIAGDNTDGTGLVRDLARNQGFAFHGARILLLGAGGAARGVLRPLLAQSPAHLVIANRTAPRAHAAAAAVATAGDVRGCGLDELGDERFDLVINATAAGLQAQVPDIPGDCLAERAWIYDMLYADEPTRFMRWAVDHGAARVLDGLGMLVEQAAESFFVWRGVRPDTAPVIAALRAPGNGDQL